MARYRVLTRFGRRRAAERRRLGIFLLFMLWQLTEVQRNCWVHPLNQERCTKGEFYTLYQDQRLYADRFFENYRMSVQQFDYLLQLLKPLISPKRSN